MENKDRECTCRLYSPYSDMYKSPLLGFSILQTGLLILIKKSIAPQPKTIEEFEDHMQKHFLRVVRVFDVPRGAT